jgi:hypothetical protein
MCRRRKIQKNKPSISDVENVGGKIGMSKTSRDFRKMKSPGCLVREIQAKRTSFLKSFRARNRVRAADAFSLPEDEG